MGNLRSIGANVFRTEVSVIAFCAEENLGSIGQDTFEAVHRLKILVNERYHNVFPMDAENT